MYVVVFLSNSAFLSSVVHEACTDGDLESPSCSQLTQRNIGGNGDILLSPSRTSRGVSQRVLNILRHCLPFQCSVLSTLHQRASISACFLTNTQVAFFPDVSSCLYLKPYDPFRVVLGWMLSPMKCDSPDGNAVFSHKRYRRVLYTALGS